MPVLTIYASSTQYVLVPVDFVVSGVEADPTADTVQMAFVTPGSSPSVGDWKSATWETTTGPPASYAARCLVGPSGGATTLSAGTFSVFLKITDNPELPVLDAGFVRVL